MRHHLTTLALISALVVPAATAGTQFSFDVHIGAPPPPRAYHVPPRPGPDYVWVEGYQYPDHGHYKWHDGYWTRPPYPGAYWVQPYYGKGTYHGGRWEGDHGVFAHDHHWDNTRERDENRYHRDDHYDDHHHDDHR
jgi:hypothetical protein